MTTGKTGEGRRGAASECEAVSRRLHALLDGLVTRKGIRHAVMAVERGDGGLCWTGAAGEASPDGAAMRVDTPFHFASVTKLYTAVVVLQLVEDGSVALDASIGDYLPRALIQGIHRLDGVDHSAAITVRHLLAHTSGLADYFPDAPEGELSYNERLIAGDFSYTIEDVCERLRRLTPYFPPQDPGASRQRARYADSNFQLLGAVVESVTGEQFQQVVEERVLVPLDLQRTWFAGHPRASTTGTPATMWAGNTPLERPEAMRSMGPEGGLIGPASEAIAFLRALLAGEVFERPQTLRQMQERFNRFGLPRSRTAIAAPGWPIQYGLGMKRFRIARLVSPGFKPATLLGHSGASGSWLFHCPEHDLYLAGTVDQTNAAAVPFRLQPKVLRACHR